MSFLALDKKIPMFNGRLGHIEDTDNIIIILGRGCNMNCPHCSQNVAKDYVSSYIVTEKYLDWLSNWSVNKSDYSGKKNILFWGGEPLVYWDNIVKIVEGLKIRGISNKDIYYRMFTNGLLLDDNKMNYMYDNGFVLTMSYDAPNPTVLRSVAPSQRVIDLFNSYKGVKVVNSVYNAQTESLVAMFKELKRIFPDAYPSYGWIRDGEGVESEFVDFPEGKVRKDVYELYNYVQTTDDGKRFSYIFKGFYTKYNKSLAYTNKELASYPFPFCSSLIKSITLDIDGNVYVCHNANKIIGNIFKDDFYDMQIKSVSIWKENQPKKCVDCEWVGVCANGCTEYRKTADGNYLTQCNFFYDYFGALRDIVCLGKSE